jgi:hypothetical protein
MIFYNQILIFTLKNPRQEDKKLKWLSVVFVINGFVQLVLTNTALNAPGVL